MTAPVVRNNAISIGKKEQHLRVPVVRRQRPAVVKHNGLSVFRTPVLVENCCAIVCRDCFHGIISFCVIQR
jgi:energy-converting hydrogenase Eha subunit A